MRRPSTDKRHFLIAGILTVIVAAVVYWLLYNALPLPLQGAAQAGTIDALFQAHMVLLSVLFALVVVFMVYAIVVFRRRDDDSEGEHFEGHSILEIAWTVIPLVLVIVFSYIGVTSLRDVLAESPDELAVNVTGRQWSWTFDYPDSGVQAAELVLPVNRPVRLDMEAQDVLHAFWVPEFRVKKDLLPGQRTTLRFTPIVEGEFEVLCAEICGLSHYSMVTPVRVVSEAEYQAWVGQTLAAQGLAPELAQQPGIESEN
jgi:cytochrome c oxidase subunit II